MPGPETILDSTSTVTTNRIHKKKTAIIIGAGPAGLTAAYELLTRTSIVPIILEKSGDIGGISKTVNYKGNRMDMGPHRFFSKSDRVMDWWMKMMPLEKTEDETLNISYQNKTREINAGNAEGKDKRNMMLVIERLTRIYFLRKFFTYPIQLSIETLTKLGPIRTTRIMFSYLRARLFPIKNETSLQDFLINRFGRELYLTFFKDYTEKVWGIPCEKISAEWGAQRIKGVSISKAIQHAVKAVFNKSKGNIGQKGTETSLIEQFLYPAKGAGQMWEEVARQVKELGGKIYHYEDVQRIYSTNEQITTVVTVNSESGLASSWKGDYFFSTMPVQELVAGMDEQKVPADVKEVAAGLQYRDFVNVGVLLKKMAMPSHKLKDSWIYIQDKGVKVGRIQIYNNWGPYMVSDPTTTWIGLEYFCNKEDDFWKQHNEAIKQLAVRELEKIGLAYADDVLDMTVQRMEKTYPAYFGTYDRFDVVRSFVDQFQNLFLVGRNGMHKYNNTDHSMLTAMVAVDNVVDGVVTKENLWEINTEQEYHEEKEVVEDVALAPVEAPSFVWFVFKTPLHRRLLWASLFFLIAQFVVFKFMYPYPNFMPDSYSYIGAAMSNQDISTWPIGYSKFLRVFSSFVHSDTVLVLFQYLFLEASVIFLIFTLLFFFKDTSNVIYFMFLFAVLNPVLIFMSNYVSADTIFTAFSLLWINTLFWMLFRPQWMHIWIHAILLFILFSIRHNAMYYPIISILAFLMSRYSLRLKLLGVGFSFFLVGLFIWHTSNQYKELTGRRAFSAFGGWQLAANALFMYSHLPAEKNVPSRFKNLEGIVRNEFDSLNKLKSRPDSILGIYYLWYGPLPKYLEIVAKKDSMNSNFVRYAQLGSLYQDYGIYLIKRHPFDFVRHYILPNMYNSYAPPNEFLGMYNMKTDSVEQVAQSWFGYKSGKVRSYSKEVRLFKYLPTAVGMLNVAFLLSIIGTFIFLKVKRNILIFRVTELVFVLWICNYFFSVFASPGVMRYQIFVIILICMFVSLLVSLLITYYHEQVQNGSL